MTTSPIALRALNPADFRILFEFEQNNRDWFERWVPPRPDGYDQFESFCHQCDALIREMNDGSGYYFLGYHGHNLIGRFNLSPVVKNVGDIGYRIGQAHIGQGYSIRFGQLLLKEAQLMGLRALTGRVLEGNPASQRTLKNLGFKPSDRPFEPVLLNGEQQKLHHYRLEL